ncbi:hypothetical protein SAMN05421770_10198 [Granulicella rosea]|uniref:Uncharacterized protein n=1 Tax=Granulicella rosea TaxID=474952 RepID=A0A239CTD1_9BACT|nr:hypothetical protein [Granulicella rosea]SNS23337.1 hypothetical protein SAMN05421770_10198 [Granulicella rosea]
MRFPSRLALIAALAAAPAFAQVNTASVTTPAMPPAATAAAIPANAADASIDYAALKEDVARQNKALTDQVAQQRAIVKKNQDLLKEAQKLQAANLKLVDEKKKLEAENAELDKQRQTLKAAQTPVASN